MSRPPLFSIGTVLLAFNVYQIVQPLSLSCDNTVSPETYAEVELELILDCSTANVNITTVFNIPEVLYTILYTCNHSNVSEPDMAAIDGAIFNQSKILDKLPCDSLCTFGGCFSLNPVINTAVSIYPLKSCYICQEGPTTSSVTTSSVTTSSSGPGSTTADPTTPGPTTQGPTTQGPTTQGPTTQGPTTQGPTTQGPSVLGFTTSSVISLSSITTLDPATLGPIPSSVHHNCTCNYDDTLEGYICKCSGYLQELLCSDITECELSICNADDCEDFQRRTSRNELISTIAIVPILLASVGFVTLLCFIAKNRKAGSVVDIAVMDSQIFFDPVDVAAPFCETRSGSLSTLLNAFDVLTSVDLQQPGSHSISIPITTSIIDIDSECCSEGYVVCRDSP